MHTYSLSNMFSEYSINTRGKYPYGTLYRVMKHMGMNPNEILKPKVL